MTLPTESSGLYDPRHERDGCGIGALIHRRGQRSHALVQQALAMLNNLRHRGAQGHDPATGDGAGITVQVPHEFFAAEMREVGVVLPPSGQYAVGTLFLPKASSLVAQALALWQEQTAAVGLGWLGYRLVPVDATYLGAAAGESEPQIVQVFVASVRGQEPLTLARSLFVLRRLFAQAVARMAPLGVVQVTSLSARTVIYKGLLLPEQLPHYFRDLSDPRLTSAIATVHSRFSTNTFPSWRLAHPFRYLCHNGEINTIRGNLNWMRARERELSAALFGPHAAQVLPLIAAGQSDSACLDEAVEILLLTGRSLPEALLLLVPEAWQKSSWFDPQRRAYAEYSATLMEPWDGPAALCFTDGTVAGAMLDRSGLRPCRYALTDDDLVILASEAGVLPVPPERLLRLGRLRPGEMLVVDTARGVIMDDQELKTAAAKAQPCQDWLSRHLVHLQPGKQTAAFIPEPLSLARQQTAFGYSREELDKVLAPMASSGEEAISSMGDDTPLAVLSQRPRLLFDYFKQQFAQVTNPAIDPLREDLVMSLVTYLGAKSSLVAGEPTGKVVRCEGPVLVASQVRALAAQPELALRRLSLLFPLAAGSGGLEQALGDLLAAAESAARGGAGALLLSDQGLTEATLAIPSLLAVAAVHHHLVQLGLRMRTDLLIETGEMRTAHHLACLLGYGATLVHPYLALSSVQQLRTDGVLSAALSGTDVTQAYVKALHKGLNKILAKMGIATLQSYCGAQIFETIGLGTALLDSFFPGTAGRLSGIGLDTLATDLQLRHAAAYDPVSTCSDLPPYGGLLHYRHQGERHAWSPETIALLQEATSSGNPTTFAAYSALANAVGREPSALRHMLQPLSGRLPVALGEVESAASIVQRFTTGAMSLGAISKESHEGLAIAMNRMHSKSNTGEGGEDAARFQPLANGDSRNSAIKQVASGRFGVTTHYLVHADELQIKIAQGAKPGEGGQLPGHKVDVAIAKLRCSTPGVALISPPPHHDIYSIEDLAQLIFDLRNANPTARISVKLVAEAGIGPIAVGVAKAGAHKILISGDSGGTGAAAVTSIKHAGAPWEMGLAEVHQTLCINKLRERVVLETDGQMRTGEDVVKAALLGADEFGFSTAPLIVQGCIMMRKCHLNTCPVGIATQDPALRAKFAGQPEHVVNFFFFVAEEVRALMAGLGVRQLADLVGQTQLLTVKPLPPGAKAASLDLAPLLAKNYPLPGAHLPFQPFQPDDYDATLLAQCQPALVDGTQVVISRQISNAQRSTGTLLSGEVARRHGARGLADGSVTLRFTGYAGQSFGAFLAGGISLFLAGAANDYTGKGLSGGRIVITPPRRGGFGADPQVIVGNTTLYGATSGSLFVAGLAGERFAVRNSGALAVVEGVGDHGCEYMTGGVAVILGPVGRNFGAGMSGGLAFVLDDDGLFHLHCNPAMIELRAMHEDPVLADSILLKQIVKRHLGHTGSGKAQALLNNWEASLQRFVKVTPKQQERPGQAQSPAVLGSVRSRKREASSHA